MRVFLPVKSELFSIVLILFLFIGTIHAQTFSTPGTTTWTAPAGVSSVMVETWGAGGKGGSRTSTFVTGGGGGGAYARRAAIAVTPGTTYNIVVGGGSSVNGTPGGDSYFINNTTVMAKGGNSAAINSTVGASGGAAGSSVGDVGFVFSGGNGATGTPNTTDGNSGGGGASGRLGFNGSNATNINGAISPVGGGSGGNGIGTNNGTGFDGANPGGGGGGAFRQGNSARYGGDGGDGRVVITFTCPTYSLTSALAAVTPACSTFGTNVTLSSNSMPSGTYTVTYNLAGATIAVGNTATMVFSSGTPGTGTFTTSALSEGLTNITITSLTSAGCSSAIVINNTASVNAVAATSATAGPAITACENIASGNITGGSSATNFTSVLWTTSGTGTLTDATSLTLCSYVPSAADVTAGSVTFTLTAFGNSPCNNVTSTKTLTIVASPVATAGSDMTACSSASTINITAGSSATSYASVLWSSSGTGTFANDNSLTTCTYNPSAADMTAGNVTLTLTITGLGSCGNAVSTKTLSFVPNPIANPGAAVFTCSSSGAVNITTGASASFYTTLLWSSSGSGTFANANSISNCTYTPSAADITAGSVIITLSAMSLGCTNGTATKTLTISSPATAVAGPALAICATGNNITGGSSASNYSSITWTSSGTGTFTNANSLTTCTYTPSPADITAGSVILTLTASGNAPCSNSVSTKVLTINAAATAVAGPAINTCSTAGAINITAGSSAIGSTSVLWTSSGTGIFTNANSLTTCTYNPSAADRTAGSVVLTLTATNASCGTDSSTKILTIFSSPTITGTTPATRTGPGTLILGATASVGTLNWYAAATGGTALGFGTSFTTPFISTTTTFYVESTNGPCTSSPRTPVVATIIFSEIDIRGNAISITDGDFAPTTTDWTDFGATNMTRTFTVYNTGVGVLTLSPVIITGLDASDFIVTAQPNSTVASGSTTTFTIAFNPLAVGIRLAAIKISTNDADEPTYDFGIQGTAVDKEADVQGNAISIASGDMTPALSDWTDFSSITATRTYTIRNLGNIILNVGTINITGLNASDFAVTSLPAATVGAYSSTTFVVTFIPSVIGSRLANIEITNDDGNEDPYIYAIRGFGVIPEMDITGNATSIVDGDTTPAVTDWTDFGSTTATRTFTIFNQGNTVLTIGAITITGANASEFTITLPPSSTVAAFSSTPFVVTFAPTAIGLRTATVNIVNNDSSENPYNFAIQGTGIPSEIDVLGNAISIVDGDITPSTTDWTDFTTVALTRTFTIRNYGNLPLTVGAITFTGTNPTEFSVITAPTPILSAFASTTFVVRFTQGGLGNRTATMNIVNNDGGENPYNIALAGFGGIPEINIRTQYNVNIADGDTTPASNDQTDFGNVSMDGGTVYANLTIQNTGSSALSIGAATFSGPNAADFTLISAPAATIAAGGNTRFKIGFTPTTIGIKSATFSLVNNDSDENPYNFELAGNGVRTYQDTDSDGVTDNKDIDDDNDGIIDIQEQIDGIAYPLTGLVQYTFLNETFGAGTTKGQININTPGATCTYCFEDGYGSACNAAVTLEDGEYTVNYKITGALASDPENIHGDLAWYDGLDHTPSDTNGRMAVFNASYTAGTFYETRVDGVIPNVPISYSFYVLNIMRQSNYVGSIRPNITVEFVDLNNNLISTFNTGFIGRCTMDPNDNSCFVTNWLPFSTSVNLGNVTSFIVRFKNNSTGGGGNDLALDDIVITQNYIDTDGDGIANIFDLDDENDGIPDVEEAFFKDYSYGLSRMDHTNPTTWTDTNENGLNDVLDQQIEDWAYYIPDNDGDGVPDYLDLDSDNDTFFDVDESNLFNGDGDINGDGKGDLLDTDRDGILDLYDNNTGFGTTVRAYAQDTDFDNIPDYLQQDSDSDGIYDIHTGLYSSLDADMDGFIDGWDDIDRDGITDTFDTNTMVIGSPRDLDRKLYLDFDGRNDYGQGTGVLGGLSTVTMMAWVNLNNAFAGDGTIVGQNNFKLRINSAKNLEIILNGNTTVFTDSIFDTARWYHVGATLGGGSLKLYLNGRNVISTSVGGSISADASLLTIGKNPVATDQYFKGKVDEVRIFNTNLTDSQFQRMVYQEIQNTGSQVRGFIVPKNIGSLPWANLLRYYRMDAYKDDIIDDLTTASVDVGSGMKIYNHKYIQVQQAPMPFITERVGTFANAVDSPLNEVRGMDIMDQDWSIVQIKHDIKETANNIDLGMFVDAGVTITSHNDIKIQNDWYLLLDGKIDLEDRAQLVQTAESDLAPTSAGSIEREQQGQSNVFNYNYWCSPVGTINTTTNNTSYTVNGVMRDGTDPANLQNITWTSAYNGAPTTPITLSSTWIYKFQNTSPVYANWSAVGQNGTLLAGQGYTLKGSGAATSTQNLAFVGKPNSGTISSPIAANNLNLSGNPYPSALDSDAFIMANGTSTTGAIYFWEHFSTNTSHVLIQYQGGYAVRNLVGGLPPVSPAEISGMGTSTRIPGRFIPVGQGFFINGSATGGNITFNNGQRAFVREDEDDSNFMFRQDSGPTVKNLSRTHYNAEDTYVVTSFGKIRLGFNSSTNFHRQILLGFMNENATSGLDIGYDAPHIDNQPNDMYFINSGKQLTIQGDGYFNSHNIFPLGVKTAAAGYVKFKLDGTEDFDENQEIYIHDNVTNIYHDIRTQQFGISLPAGTINNRFSLRFTNDARTALATTDFGIDKAAVVVGFTNVNRTISIVNNISDSTVETVMLFNMVGQCVATWDVKNQNQTDIAIPVKNLSTGTYIIKALTTTGDITKKVIIK